jgi:hypothetical protein
MSSDKDKGSSKSSRSRSDPGKKEIVIEIDEQVGEDEEGQEDRSVSVDREEFIEELTFTHPTLHKFSETERREILVAEDDFFGKLQKSIIRLEERPLLGLSVEDVAPFMNMQDILFTSKLVSRSKMEIMPKVTATVETQIRVKFQSSSGRKNIFSVWAPLIFPSREEKSAVDIEKAVTEWCKGAGKHVLEKQLECMAELDKEDQGNGGERMEVDEMEPSIEETLSSSLDVQPTQFERMDTQPQVELESGELSVPTSPSVARKRKLEGGRCWKGVRYRCKFLIALFTDDGQDQAEGGSSRPMKRGLLAEASGEETEFGDMLKEVEREMMEEDRSLGSKMEVFVPDSQREAGSQSENQEAVVEKVDKIGGTVDEVGEIAAGRKEEVVLDESVERVDKVGEMVGETANESALKKGMEVDKVGETLENVEVEEIAAEGGKEGVVVLGESELALKMGTGIESGGDRADKAAEVRLVPFPLLSDLGLY